MISKKINIKLERNCDIEAQVSTQNTKLKAEDKQPQRLEFLQRNTS